MAYIKTIPAAQARGEVRELYQREQGLDAQLPNYASVFCYRPQVMSAWAALQAALKQHLDTKTYCLVNLAAARAGNSSYCALAYGNRLVARYFSARELRAILRDTDDSPLTGRERAAMRLATKVARDASEVEAADIEAARAAGYSDAEVFDIVAAAAGRCFFSRIPDALGAMPDASLAKLEPQLLELLLVGRPLAGEPSEQRE